MVSNSAFCTENAQYWLQGRNEEDLDMSEMNMMFRLHEVTFDDPSMADQNGWYLERIHSVNEEVRVDRLIGPFKTEDDAAEAARTTLRDGPSLVGDSPRGVWEQD